MKNAKIIFKRGLAFLLSVIMVVGSLAYLPEKALADTTPTVKICGFAKGETTNLRSSELLMAKVEGYDGDTTKLIYKWTNLGQCDSDGNLLNEEGWPLYIYNNHNMMDEYCGKYGLNSSGQKASSEDLIKMNNTRGFAGSLYAAIDGRAVTVKTDKGKKSISYSGQITASKNTPTKIKVEIYAPNATNTRLAYDEVIIGDIPDLQKDVENCSFAMFTGETRSIQNFLAQAGIVHVTCAGCKITQAKISNNAPFTLNDANLTAGNQRGTGTVTFDLSKGSCRFHNGYSATATLDVAVFNTPDMTSTNDTITLTNLDPDCEYYIGNTKGEVKDEKIVFKGLDRNTEYEIDVVATTPSGNKAYEYLHKSTTNKFDLTVNLKLDGALKNINDIEGSDAKLYLKQGTSNYIDLTNAVTSTGSAITGQYVAKVEGDKTYTLYLMRKKDGKYSLDGIPFSGSIQIVDSNKSLDIDYYSINYNANTGTIKGQELYTEYYSPNFGKAATTVNENPLKDYYDFINWVDVSDESKTYGKGASLGTLDKKLVLKANWDKHMYSIKINLKKDNSNSIAKDIYGEDRELYCSSDGTNYKKLEYNSGKYVANIPHGEYKIYSKSATGDYVDECTQINIDGTKDVYEKEINYYTITYDLNGGNFSSSENDIVKIYNAASKETIELLDEPSRTNYIFMGWKDEEDGLVYDAKHPLTGITKPLIYTALWEEKTYNLDVTFYYNNSPTDASSILGKDTTVYVKKNGTDDYIELDYENSSYGYSKEVPNGEYYVYTKTGTGDYASTSAKVLINNDVGETSISYYTVDYNLNGGKLDNSNEEVIHKLYNTKENDTLTLPKTPTRTNYSFKGWKDTVSGKVYKAGEEFGKLEEGLRFEAVWELDTYSATVSFKKDGVVVPIEEIYGKDSSVALSKSETEMRPMTKNADNTYSLMIENGEYKVCVFDPEQKKYVPLNKNISISNAGDTEVFNYYTISYKLDGGKLDNTTEDIVKLYAEGKKDVCVLATPEKPNYGFKGWSIEGTSTVLEPLSKLEPISKTLVLKALWEENKYATTITIKLDGTKKSADDILGRGTDVYVSKDGKEFIKLTKDADGNYVVDLLNGEYKLYTKTGDGQYENLNQTVKVNGKPVSEDVNYFTVTVDTNTGAFDNGKKELKTTVLNNTSYVIPTDKVTKENYDFLGWKVNDKKDLAKSGDKIVVTEATKILAQWKIIPNLDDKTPKDQNDLSGKIADKDFKDKIPLDDKEKDDRVDVNLLVKQKTDDKLPENVKDVVNKEIKELLPTPGNTTTPDGKKKTVSVDGDKAVEVEVEENDDEIITTTTTTKVTPACYFDVNLSKKVGDKEPTPIQKTNGQLKVSIDVPKEYQNAPEGTKRTYQIMQVVDGKEVVVPAEYDPTTGMLTFATDLFAQVDGTPSTCVLLVKDVDVKVDRVKKLRSAKLDNNKPAPGDTIHVTVKDDTGKNVTENLAYQWQYSPDGKNWYNISGETKSSLYVADKFIGKLLRCVVKGTNGVEGIVYATAKSKVSNEANVPTIVMNKELGINKKFQIKMLNTNGAKINVYSKNPKIVSINKNGIVTGKKLGKAKVVLSIVKGKKRVQYVTSVRVVKSVSKNYSLSKFSADYNGPSVALYKLLYVKGKYTISLKHINKGATVKYTSSNKKIATVSKKGVVKGKKKGTAKITISIKQKGIVYKYFVVCRVCKKGKVKNDTNYLTVVK